MNDEPPNGEQSPNNPRSVSRGLKLQTAFLGIDSLYLVMEYPHVDVFQFWASQVGDFLDPRLFDGIPFEDFLIRRGGLGYKLSVWINEARLFITDRVDDNLGDSDSHGMGIMLQLSPKWLWKYGDVVSAKTLQQNILAQLAVFGVENPSEYRIRLNRMDINLDVRGLPMSDISIAEWQHHWVGYANRKSFHISPTTRQLECLSIGTSSGVIRFKRDCSDPEISAGLAFFLRVLFGIRAKELNGEL